MKVSLKSKSTGEDIVNYSLILMKFNRNNAESKISDTSVLESHCCAGFFIIFEFFNILENKLIGHV